MKKYIKQVKKGLAALLAVGMVMGATPLGVLAFTPPTIQNVINSETVSFIDDVITETEQAFVKDFTDKFAEGHFKGHEDFVMNMFNTLNRVQTSTPARLDVADFSAGNWYVSIIRDNEFMPVIEDISLQEDDEYPSLNSGSSFAMPSDAQAGDVLFVALNRGSIKFGEWRVYAIEYVGGGTPTQQPTPIPDTISVTINSTAVNFTDQQPTIIDGRTLVPIRGVFEQLGYDVRWDEGVRQAVLIQRSGAIIITITIDSTTFVVTDDRIGRNESISLDVPAQIINGRTMIPLRAVLESVGYELAWDGDTQTVIISTN